MKQIIYILLATTMLGLMSCSDWLDVSPKTSIPTDKQFESESGFKDALTGIYLKLGIQTLYAGDTSNQSLQDISPSMVVANSIYIICFIQICF